MDKWKNPPKAKVYEALSAVIDGRVELLPGGVAQVVSSAGNKTYKVRWIEGTPLITSNDKASRFQGYAGYPIIAVLLATRRIPFDPAVAKPLAGAHWNEINIKFKRDYDAAVDYVLVQSEASLEERDRLSAMVDEIYEALTQMGLEKLVGRPG